MRLMLLAHPAPWFRVATCLLLGAWGEGQAAPAATSTWAAVGGGGQLTYRADERGNTIPDFSRAGYGGGGVALPELPVIATLAPQPAGDDGARIQAALDAAGEHGLDTHGRRGAVLLQRGTYRIEGVLVIRANGVALRGEGAGENGTVIVATGTNPRT